MDVTLTIQADEKLHAALRERAEMQGKTVPELAHEILREAVAEPPLKERIGHLRGQLTSLPEDPDPRRRQIRERNWRP